MTRRRLRVPSPAYLLLIERRVLAEPIAVEPDPAGRPQPAGFWRGKGFHRIVRVIERRFERGESYLRVLTDQGCFDLRRVSELDPWTWKLRERWQLTADLAAIPVGRPLR
jgi:hypothetical protein